MLNSNEFTGIHQVNSVDFVQSAFQVYNSGNILVVLKQSNSDFEVNKEIFPQSGGGWIEFKQAVIQEDRPAQIVFTSGTEGEPKAILISHKSLADVVTRLNDVMQVDSTISEYVGIPVTYSFGFGRCRAVCAAGGRCFIPENGFNPPEIARMLAANEINAISAVPTLWRTLLAQAEIIGDLGKKVKWIEIGSQYMSREEKEKLKQLFPNAIIVQHYGLTEASRTTFLKINGTEGDLLESVGQAIGEVEVKISPDGLIMIRGPHVAMGRVINGEINGLVDADGWYTTGDFGRMEKGYLYYEGRADDLINCAGVKVSPELLQEKINRRLDIENKVAVCRIADVLRGDGFFIAVESGSGVNINAVREASFEELLKLGVNAGSSVKVEEVYSIPRTDTGKVRRKELSGLYTQHQADLTSHAKVTTEVLSVRDMFTSIFPGIIVKPGDTFKSLGGDSLSYIQMLMMLESRFGYAPGDWDKMSIERLENLENQKRSPLFSWLDTSIFLRVIAILAVVAIHSGVGKAFGGGTLLLFALIGFNMARFKSADFIEGKIWPWIKSYAIIILIPYYIAIILYFWWNESFEIDELLLYSNLIDAKLSILFPFWFVQVLLQCLILTGLIFSIPLFRKYASSLPVIFSFSVLAVMIAIRVIYPVLWDAEHLHHLVPLRFMAILWLGWCFYFAEDFVQKLILCVAGISFAFIDTGLLWGFDFSSPNTGLAGQTKWLVLGSIFLAFVPRVPVPAFAKNIFNDIGAATFYIFVLNGAIIKMLEYAFQMESAWAIFCLTMAGSMVVWLAMERLRVIERLNSALSAKTVNPA